MQQKDFMTGYAKDIWLLQNNPSRYLVVDATKSIKCRIFYITNNNKRLPKAG
jgi:hypothetical protein